MKSFIMGIAIFVVSLLFTIFQQDYNLHQQQLYKLKQVAIEASTAAAQYTLEEEYALGKLVFNQTEGKKASDYIIQNQLVLNESLLPLLKSYWQEKVEVTVQFYDDSNSIFPFLYFNTEGTYALAITEPTVIVTINAGKPRYRLGFQAEDSVRIAAHSWKGY